jgi:hypothetical protein
MNKPVSKSQAAFDRVARSELGQGGYINMVAQQLNVIAEETVARLPENIFAQVFLPLLAGDKELQHKASIADWISIAGTPYKSVDVFDPTTGKVLFRVPPVFDYNGVNPVRDPADRRQKAIAEVVHLAEQYTNIHPMQGVNYLRNVLGQRALIMNSNQKLAKHVLVWNEIFKRYNRPPLGATEGVNNTPEQAGPVSTPGEEPEYEEF